jgi:hypothetical protein
MNKFPIMQIAMIAISKSESVNSVTHPVPYTYD